MFLHTVAIQEQAISADGVQQFDLPVNPLSALLICLRPLNDTGTLTDFQSYRGIATALNRITVSHRGASIKSYRGEDLVALNFLRHGIVPFQGQHDETNNERRCVVLPILFGRHAYDTLSCFPASRRGELVLELDMDIADTGYDTLRLSVEAVELLGVTPREYERETTITQTWAATGINDMELPVGNRLRGLTLFGTTGFGGATPAPSWGRIKTMVDNQEVGYGSCDFEVAQMLGQLWGRGQGSYGYDTHIHNFEPVAGVVTIGPPFNVSSSGAAGNDSLWQYGFLDLDPTRDDTHSLDLTSAVRAVVRADAETADAVRCIATEAVAVAGSA